MTKEEVATANELLHKIKTVEAAQAALAISGTKVRMVVVDSKGAVVVTSSSIQLTLGDTAYDSLAAASEASLETALGTAKSDAETELGLL